MEGANFSFFVVGDEPARLQNLKVDANGDPIRRRQQHRKSRNGCKSCKKRKVKCDEQSPCSNCRKRGIDCSLVGVSKPHGSSAEPPTFKDAAQQCSLPVESEPVCPSTWHQQPEHGQCPQQPAPTPEDWTGIEIIDDSPRSAPTPTIFSNVDLILRHSAADRELIQHFERSTSRFLAMSPTIWSSAVYDAALRNDHLMSAVMLVAAAHINHYLSKDDPKRRPVLQHFVNTLSGLRMALAEKISITNFDAIMGCSLMLIQYRWSYIDLDLSSGVEIADLFLENINLFCGLKDCVMAVVGNQPPGEDFMDHTIWGRILEHSPREKMEQYLFTNKARWHGKQHDFHHCLYCGLGSRDRAGSSPDNVNALSRLIIVLNTIKVAYPDLEGSGMADDIYRYLFTWPPFLTDGFMNQLREHNSVSFLILFYYYAAIVSVYSERIWWMKDRAFFMYETLRGMLDGKCERCTSPAIALGGGDFDWSSNYTTFKT
ncbi:uncharacterized protein PAC_18434 [Phialocephala subalpina]|uniref:Zn(2)-C6 fungal-type domain-containing protein n=1 Tax=Phialocephala subalpina TaxID=576137 RepID=A0A1L7XU45_9HELO|nr:uncharacterized protein PAC_18434 [Phialocephala subalpina]